MKVQILSDLHCEFDSPPYSWHIPETEGELIILAGDIGVGIDAINWSIQESERLQKPILQLIGNHELYHNSFELINQYRNILNGTRVQLLEMNSVKLNDITFMGATLWTDYLLYGSSGRITAMNAARSFMSDHRLIQRFNGMNIFSPGDAEEINKISLEWLNKELQVMGKKVVITHHAPSIQCLAHKYRGDMLSPAFASDLEGLIVERSPDLWISGHTHFNNDFMIANTRILSNQRGYPKEGIKGFVPNLTIEV